MIETELEAAGTARRAPRTRSSGIVRPAPALFVRPIVFLGGFSSVGVELAASRLIAPYFGSSTFIWANLIGLTLAYLSLGYWLGGRVADRWPRPAVLFSVTAVAAFVSGLIPVMSRPILSASLRAFDGVDVGAFYGALLGVLLLFAIPITLLGFVTPFAIRLRIADATEAGSTAGDVYALSTVGSIAGSFLPVIVLIPLFGTARTFLSLSLALLLPSLLALAAIGARLPALAATAMTAILVLVGATRDAGAIKPPDRGRLVYETESDANYIQVLEQDGRYLLALNEGHAVHSIYDPDELLTRGPWDYFMVGPLFNPNAGTVDNALLIGLAGGTVARQLTAAYGPIPIDGVEIDAEIARVADEYFGMGAPEMDHVTTFVADGRYFLRTTDRTYDLIGVDAYRQPYIPFQLTTKEFFREVADRLSPNGVAVINVGRTSTDYRLADVVASTMKVVFPNVYLIETERYANTIVVGTKQPTDIESFAANVARLPAGGVLREVGERSLATGEMREVPAGGRVFTDDRAPVELVVDQMILDAARSEDER